MTAGFVPAAQPHLPTAAPRSSFVPRIDLTSGRITGFLAVLAARGPGRRIGEDELEPFEDRIDREVADVLVVARAAGTSPTTVHLPVPADAVAWAPHRLRAVRPAMLHGAGRGAGVSLLLGTRARTASTAALAEGIAQARHDGFGIALPASGFAPPEIVRLAPDHLVLDPACLAGVEAGDPCALATLEAATTLTRAGVVDLVADGVRDEAMLRDLRDRGARVASGPILAAEQPSALPAEATLAPGLSSRLRTTRPEVAAAESDPGRPDREVTLGDVARPATVMPRTATGDEVRATLADDGECAGVVLVDGEGRPTGYVDRNRFLLTIAGPYGRAVFAHRDAARLADEPTLRPTTMSVRDAVRDRLDGDPARRYDDVVLTEPDGRTVRIARFADLVRALDPAAEPGPGAAPVPLAETGPPSTGMPGRGRHRLVGLRPRPAVIVAG